MLMMTIMKALIQRVRHAQVEIDQHCVGKINQGILALVCVEASDSTETLEKMAHKLINYRIFEDEQGKMNLSVAQINGGLLIVPQFTLAADTRKGMRPSFSNACPPALAIPKFEAFMNHLHTVFPHVAQGQFGADMQVSLCNDGPVTLWLEVNNEQGKA